MANATQTFQRTKVEVPFELDAPDPVAARVAEHFEGVYRDAAGDDSRLPWHDGRANPSLVCWLNAEAPRLVRPGVRAVVVGCGLGDDVAELETRGYDAVGFDVSPTCVAWARARHPGLADRLVIADATRLPSNLRCRFELVVECYTIQSVPPEMRDRVVRGVVSLAKPHGVVVAVARARPEGWPLAEVTGPPYPLTRSELVSLFEAEGFVPVRAPDEFEDDETPPVARLRCAFRRA
ncbi:MAG: methyltransferase domain-containing protein [Phycisphaeraceae bacterium]|nr:methyltransferase domain-containing protein [Phycisphaeraceae bacterium]